MLPRTETYRPQLNKEGTKASVRAHHSHRRLIVTRRMLIEVLSTIGVAIVTTVTKQTLIGSCARRDLPFAAVPAPAKLTHFCITCGQPLQILLQAAPADAFSLPIG